MENNKGFVSLVGAGPGDVGLVTQKGIQCLNKADVILYDRLVNPRLLRYAKETCEFIYCGKLPKRHILRQEKINEMLVQLAIQGKYVARLKGGDPTVFGRVGEEAEELVKHGVSFEIVPGITSSIAAAAYAGIPVTHRNYSNSFTVRTGHACESNGSGDFLGKQMGETIAYYMGVKSLPGNCQKLIEQGKSVDTKVAVIQWATLGKQRVVEGTLASIAGIVEKEKIENPAMMIVGEVISLRDSLAWFEKKRFSGRRILVAKASAGDYRLENYFTAHGAESFSFPTLQRKQYTFTATDLETIMNAKRIIFATPESVEIFLSQLTEAGYDIRELPRCIECLSEITKKSLAARGIIAYKANNAQEHTVMIGHKSYQDDPAIHGKTTMFFSHELVVDTRFDEINERLLNEDKWETVIFPNKAAVNSYVSELNKIRIEHLRNIPFAYVGESVKRYAMELGFSKIDEEIQSELERNEWKCER
ncbi:uroporphyrinogen-III C-methyltransferase [Metabacillus litoralis]|uniref:uroporphyrinogen-III C-methyltransferase n=1 Tax=Metabacillus litoralis TaxID=152268 RepID=UPI00203DEEB0|nr:uroporphyrinogen-III C-methyltransferase [Metabacillus litoralis]MCM3653497.1 uroporphyrinogen-III C-methyltransferase [Metabacillus litoralis]